MGLEDTAAPVDLEYQDPVRLMVHHLLVALEVEVDPVDLDHLEALGELDPEDMEDPVDLEERVHLDQALHTEHLLVLALEEPADLADLVDSVV